MINLRMKQVIIFMNGSLNHWLTWFIQRRCCSFSNETPLCWPVALFGTIFTGKIQQNQSIACLKC